MMSTAKLFTFHIIAAQLVNLIRESDDDSEIMKQLAAGGFKDITRYLILC